MVVDKKRIGLAVSLDSLLLFVLVFGIGLIYLHWIKDISLFHEKPSPDMECYNSVIKMKDIKYQSFFTSSTNKNRTFYFNRSFQNESYRISITDNNVPLIVNITAVPH